MKKNIWGLVCAAVLACAPMSSIAQAWPTKPVKFVLPGPPGSSPDRITRLIAERLSNKWGQPVVIDNKPGASTRVGAEIVARSAPDGYTLLSTFVTHSTVKLLYPQTPYDPVNDFAAITQYATPESIFAVHTDSPYKTFQELVAGVKAANRPLRYAHFGNGSSFHVYGLMVGRDAGIQVLPVPYKGEALQMNDLLGGHIESSFNSVGTALPHIRAGKVRPLGIITSERSKVLPDVPTFKELGIKGMERGGWFGFLAPSGTPQPVIDKIYRDVKEILTDPEVSKIMRDQGIEPVGSTPEEFARTIRNDVEEWRKLVVEFDVKPS
ncbi:tripartite tricarboxylate transporter substrate binding protein [Ramlibacter sp. AN1015]|uniref:Bug family tripartite tricarboxylate transporter substrate binding protein n=1 Tax=Ramlibacter sp. AN1015 TaxID=3133428 RepID=UPI0030C28CFE